MSGPSRVELPGRGHGARWIWKADGEGGAESSIEAADRSVHIFGNFGGGTLTIQGSNDPLTVDWATLRDTTGAEIVVTDDILVMIAENPEFIRPKLSGATNPDLHINMVSRKS